MIDYPDFLPSWYVDYDWGMYDVSLNSVNETLSPHHIVMSNIHRNGSGEYCGKFWQSHTGCDNSISGKQTPCFHSKEEVLYFVNRLIKEAGNNMASIFKLMEEDYKYMSGDLIEEGEVLIVVIKKVDTELVKNKQGTEKKVLAYFSGKEKPLIVSKKNARAMVDAMGTDDHTLWIGKPLALIRSREKHFGDFHNCIRVDIDETRKAARTKKPTVTKSTKKKSPFLTWWDSLTGEQQTAGKGQVLDALSTHPRYSEDLHPLDDISVCIAGGAQSIPIVKDGKDTDNIKACVDIYNVALYYADMMHSGKTKFDAMTALQDGGSLTDLNNKWIAAVTADYEDIASASEENGTRGQQSLFPEEAGGSNNNAQLI